MPFQMNCKKHFKICYKSCLRVKQIDGMRVFDGVWGDSKIVVGKTVNLMWQRGGGSILGKISMTSFMNPPSCAK